MKARHYAIYQPVYWRQVLRIYGYQSSNIYYRLQIVLDYDHSNPLSNHVTLGIKNQNLDLMASLIDVVRKRMP